MASFKCTSNSTCTAIVDYISPNTTTLSHIASIFDITDLPSILGVNSLPTNTHGTHPIQAQQKIRIPFPCSCGNGNTTGVSNHTPNYTVVANDGLSHIAADVFSGLVTYQEIGAVNGIVDLNNITVGQKLWIPLPCSCDEVGGDKVVHYGYVVPAGSSVSLIAQEFGTTEQTLLTINGMKTASSLQAAQVLDVPLKACTSMVNTSSLDYPLLVANGTYMLTANNCVMCTCSASNNYTLQCQASGLQPSSGRTCPSTQCSGSGNLSLGNSTTSSCKTTCAYAGYTQNKILTTLIQDSTCTDSKNKASKTHLQTWSLTLVALLIYSFIFSS